LECASWRHHNRWLGLGEDGIWLALPLADAALVVVTLAVLRARARQAVWGLFQAV
jgi:hypothetical protein